MRSSKIVFLALLALTLGATYTEAQTKKPKAEPTRRPMGQEVQSTIDTSTEGIQKWKRTSIPNYGLSFAYKADWTAYQIEHPDPDDEAIADPSQPDNINAIEINQEGFESGLPSILVYSIKKRFQTWEEYGSRLESQIKLMDASIIGADTTFSLKGYPGYDVTFQVPNTARVRSIVVYAKGYRIGLMYTVFDQVDKRGFKKHMPDFERLLETLQF